MPSKINRPFCSHHKCIIPDCSNKALKNNHICIHICKKHYRKIPAPKTNIGGKKHAKQERPHCNKHTCITVGCNLLANKTATYCSHRCHYHRNGARTVDRRTRGPQCAYHKCLTPWCCNMAQRRIDVNVRCKHYCGSCLRVNKVMGEMRVGLEEESLLLESFNDENLDLLMMELEEEELKIEMNEKEIFIYDTLEFENVDIDNAFLTFLDTV
jgi:hypothetical protein